MGSKYKKERGMTRVWWHFEDMDLQNNFSFATKHCVISLKAGQEQKI